MNRPHLANEYALNRSGLMFADFFDELRGRGIGVLLGLVLGALMAWLFARWRRYRERLSILKGDARDTVVINHHLVETADGPEGKVPAVMRIRSLGQSEVSRVVPNGYLASELLRRALRVTPRDTLISMEDAEGSYLLEALTNFVCDRVGNAAFDHDLYVMAPCCEPAGLAEHQPITIILVSVTDLALFEGWQKCRKVRVEHGTDGARVLTLMELARRFRTEQAHMAELRKAGKRTRYVETMYILDLALDKRSADIPVRDVPWGRFEEVLKQLNLE
jgi:hypothetical protein